MSIGKKFSTGIAVVVMLVIGIFAVGSLTAMFSAFVNKSFSEALIQLIVFAILVFILGVVVTSTWYKRKVR
jgi:cytochrome bd-type quinol oxidase subunit 1